MQVLITPAPAKSVCFWCRNQKKECVTTQFSSGFLQGQPLCFECLERATRVQFESGESGKSTPLSGLKSETGNLPDSSTGSATKPRDTKSK